MNHLLADAPVAKPLQRCLDVLQDVLPHSATAFYRVDRQQQPHDFVLRHMPQEVHQRYVARYMGHDPLHPARLARQPLDVVTLGSALPAAQRATSRYAPFLASNRLVDVAEILLRRQGRVVAGFSLLRQGRMPGFADDELRAAWLAWPAGHGAGQHAEPALPGPRHRADRARAGGGHAVVYRCLQQDHCPRAEYGSRHGQNPFIAPVSQV
jgi:hypothetical protein